MAYSSKKNLLKSRDVYNRYYGDFRGVDFSSDHTQVIDQRLAYAVNMYKDYQSGQGKALETIAGFRRRVNSLGNEIYGIHHFQHKVEQKSEQKVLIHSGTNLYLWHNYPLSIDVEMKMSKELPEASDTDETIYEIKFEAYRVVKVEYNGTSITNFTYENKKLTVTMRKVPESNTIDITYTEGTMGKPLFENMNERKSASFVFNNRLYIIDGKNYLYFDGKSIINVLADPYVPTTYRNVIAGGVNADGGKEKEARNWLTPKFKNTFVPSGTAEFYMSEGDLDSIDEVIVYGQSQAEGVEYELLYDRGKLVGIHFLEGNVPKSPSAVNYPEGYAGVEITASKNFIYDPNPIPECTLCAVFDNHVFLSGNPQRQNDIFYCGFSYGYENPAYFPVNHWMQDGTDTSRISGLLPVADTLMVLKEDTQQDGSVYFHAPQSTGADVLPKIYPSMRGLAGVGCLGACTSFLDDPVFVSRLGLEAVGQLSIRLERAIEHRSSLIDAKLVNIGIDKLKNAVLEEWNGYLILLVDGKIFMADSRQRYTHDTGVMQYEWYYLEDIGIYQGQYIEYKYATQMFDELKGATVEHNGEQVPLMLADAVIDASGDIHDLRGTVANPPNMDGTESERILTGSVNVEIDGKPYTVNVHFVLRNNNAYLCESRGNYTGGAFQKACVIKSIDNNLFFGTENGVICSFNFDKRNEYGDIPSQYYSFDERTIHCGCATKMDCCGVPHLTKNTVKKSTVIKTKSYEVSAAKIKVRTNKKPYNQIARINSSLFSFDNMDFSDFSFITTEQSLFAIKEKEKQWVEKQYYIYSDEYLKPFSIYYISYRYSIAGRYKE